MLAINLSQQTNIDFNLRKTIFSLIKLVNKDWNPCVLKQS